MNTLNNASPAEVDTKEAIDTQYDEAGVQIVKLDQLLNDPNCEFRNILHQVYIIAAVLQRLGNKENKNYAQDKELEMCCEIKNINSSYNNWKVVTITIISGGLTILGGFVGIVGVLPGTAAGQGLANLAPKAFSFFANSKLAGTLGKVGQAVGGVGQGSGAFGKIFESGDEARRAVYQFALNQQQRKQDECNKAATDCHQQCREAISRDNQTEEGAHQTVSRLMDTRA